MLVDVCSSAHTFRRSERMHSSLMLRVRRNRFSGGCYPAHYLILFLDIEMLILELFLPNFHKAEAIHIGV